MKESHSDMNKCCLINCSETINIKSQTCIFYIIILQLIFLQCILTRPWTRNKNNSLFQFDIDIKNITSVQHYSDYSNSYFFNAISDLIIDLQLLCLNASMIVISNRERQLE